MSPRIVCEAPQRTWLGSEIVLGEAWVDLLGTLWEFEWGTLSEKLLVVWEIWWGTLLEIVWEISWGSLLEMELGYTRMCSCCHRSSCRRGYCRGSYCIPSRLSETT